jgi:hypothetical protein
VKDVTGIPARVALLAPTGESLKIMVSVCVNMCVTRPNSFGVITGISET